MDFLSHLFLPLTAVYVVRREWFDTPWLLGVAGFGLLSDFDKFLGMPGLLHSLITLVPICLAILAVEHWIRGDLHYSPVIVALVGSHLVLDVLDGGPVPFAFPLIETGIGLQYPARTVFGSGWFGVSIDGPLVALRTSVPRPGNRTYGFIQGAGIASMLLFGLVFASDRWRRWRGSLHRTSSAVSTGQDQTNEPTASESGRSEP